MTPSLQTVFPKCTSRNMMTQCTYANVSNTCTNILFNEQSGGQTIQELCHLPGHVLALQSQAYCQTLHSLKAKGTFSTTMSWLFAVLQRVCKYPLDEQPSRAKSPSLQLIVKKEKGLLSTVQEMPSCHERNTQCLRGERKLTSKCGLREHF